MCQVIYHYLLTWQIRGNVMSMWEYQECLALFWNREGDVFGIRVKTKNQKLQLLDSAVFNAEDGFASALSEITERLLLPSTHLIVVGGCFEGSVCFDISIPSMPTADIRQAIEYELPRHIPCDASDMVSGYRILDSTPADEGKSPRLLIRIFAILKKEWNELITEFTSTGVRVDAILHPYMVLDPIMGDEERIFFPDIDDDFIYVKSEGSHLRKMIRIEKETEEDYISPIPGVDSLPDKIGFDSEMIREVINDDELKKFIPSMLMAAYSLSPAFREGQSHLIQLPRELIPERFRRLKIFFIFLLSLTVILFFGLIGRYWWDAWSRLASLESENRRIETKIKKVEKENKKLEVLDDAVIKELLEAEIGNSQMARCIHEISVVMPKKMWISHLTTKDKSIDMSVRSPVGKQGNIISALNGSGIFKTTRSNTRRNTDGTVNIYVHMDVVNPSETKEKK